MRHVRRSMVRIPSRMSLWLALAIAMIPGPVLAVEVAHVNAATAPVPGQPPAATDTGRREAGRQTFRRETPDAYSLAGWLRRAVGSRPGAVRGDDNRLGADYRSTFDQSGRFFGPRPTSGAGVRLTWGGPDRTVSFQYALYQPGDAVCCPTGGGTLSAVEVGNQESPTGEARDAGTLRVSTDRP